MTLTSALAKIWQANSHEELDKASTEFTEILHKMKEQIQEIGAAMVFRQSVENYPRAAKAESAQS